MRKLNLIFFLLFTILSLGQNQIKIDSTFHHYFKALELETSGEKIDFSKDGLYYEQVFLDDGEIVSRNKYAGEALTFFEEITKIKAPVKETAIWLSPNVDKNVLMKWKEWYSQNKKKIKWCENLKKPCIK